jgi:hypothetical protein
MVKVNNPTILIAIPVIVGSVAFVMPEANALALPVPKKDTTSKTSIIPVTVPNKPRTGHKVIKI